MKLLSLVFIAGLAASTLSYATAYNLSAAQTGFTSATSFNGNTIAMEAMGSNSSAISGTLDINGSYASLDLNIAPLAYGFNGYSNMGYLEADGTSLQYSSDVVSDSYSDYGGYGSYYYDEYYYYETIFGTSVAPTPADSTGSGTFGPLITTLINNLAVEISVGDIILFGEESYNSYSYDDPSQTGTPTYSGYYYSYDHEPFELIVTYTDATSGEFLLSETFAVSYTPVPVPAAGWLFASALGVFVARKRKR